MSFPSLIACTSAPSITTHISTLMTSSSSMTSSFFALGPLGLVSWLDCVVLSLWSDWTDFFFHTLWTFSTFCHSYVWEDWMYISKKKTKPMSAHLLRFPLRCSAHKYSWTIPRIKTSTTERQWWACQSKKGDRSKVSWATNTEIEKQLNAFSISFDGLGCGSMRCLMNRTNGVRLPLFVWFFLLTIQGVKRGRVCCMTYRKWQVGSSTLLGKIRSAKNSSIFELSPSAG